MLVQYIFVTNLRVLTRLTYTFKMKEGNNNLFILLFYMRCIKSIHVLDNHSNNLTIYEYIVIDFTYAWLQNLINHPFIWSVCL